MWEQLQSWFESSVPWLAATALSVTLFVGTLVAIPILSIRLPSDYFVRPSKPRPRWKVVLRTAFAALLIVMGLLMLVLPGQGILTLLIGISLLDFPAKRAWQNRLLQRPAVLRTMNRLRARAGRPPLQTDSSAPG